MLRRALLLIALLIGLPGGLAHAQKPAAQTQSVLQPTARAQMLRADTTRTFRTRSITLPDAAGGRVDVQQGVLRAAYRIGVLDRPEQPPEAAARAYLSERAKAFGWRPSLRHLRLDTMHTGPGGSTHLTYQQTLGGVPVYGRQVKVNLNAAGRPVMVTSGYAPELARAEPFDATPRLSPGEAQSEAQRLVQDGTVRTSAPELVVYPGSTPRLAWRLLAWPTAASAEWEVLLDARTGALLHLVDRTVRMGKGEREEKGKRERGKGEERGSWRVGETESGRRDVGGRERVDERTKERGREKSESPKNLFGFWGRHRFSVYLPPLSTDLSPSLRGRDPIGRGGAEVHLFEIKTGSKDARRHQRANAPTHQRADGTGYVFDPDPLSTAGTTYDETFGAPYNDGGDQSTAALRAERQEVSLRDLSQTTGGAYHLVGPHVRIIGENASGEVTYTPPTASTPEGFRYRRSQSGFEAVNAYYHVDRAQRHVQELGFTDRQNAPMRVNPRALSNDASRYFPGLNIVELGTGGVDDAEDATVVWHEYAHALLEAAAPGLRASREGQALHEGWADYWAASYVRYLVEQGTLQRTDWRRLFKWDSGDGSIWPGRVLDDDGHYPEDVRCDDTDACSIYADGLLWATALMEIYSELGRTVTDRLNLASHVYLSHPVTFRDAAEALIQADRALYQGAHVEVLLDLLAARGLAEAGAYGPTLVHDPLPPTEQTGGTQEVSATVTPVSSPVDTVRLVYGYGARGSLDRTTLLQRQDEQFVGALPLPDEPDTVRYYLEAIDRENRVTRLPPAAPDSVYQLVTGPDQVPPVIEHTSSEPVALAAWPLPLTARIEDRIGLDSVGVAYEVVGPDGTRRTEGRFGLDPTSGAYYQGTFPISASALSPGSVVRYRVFARDAAEAGNTTLAPSSGWFTVQIKRRGRLRTYDFEHPASGLEVTGTRIQGCPTCLWTRARPTYGVEVARSGQRVIGIAPDTAYAAASARMALTLPPLDLRGAEAAYLVFWHWYDFEHDGTATPDGANATLWDGGNVKISTDGGVTWQVAQPEGGYNGTLAEGRQNPLGGQPGFGGYSYSWRRVVVPLPRAEEVRIRFEAGTDASNEDAALYYAGWYLDDAVVTTERPHDEESPSVVSPPPDPITRTPKQPPAPISVRVQDSTGVTDVKATYQAPGASERDTVRLAMSATDRHVFQGQLAPAATPSFGEELTYRLLIRDAAGNQTVYPTAKAAPLRIQYRNVQTQNALNGVTATGDWVQDADGWRTRESAAQNASSLVLRPVYLPDSTEALALSLLHAYQLGTAAGGNVKIRPEGDTQWRVLTPETGYDGTFRPGAAHPMRSESAFMGGGGNLVTTTFDLMPYAGQEVQLRLDLGTSDEGLPSGAFWRIQKARFQFTTSRDQFSDPSTLALRANYPDPFADRTTLHYTVPSTQHVRLAVYDALGRRVAVLVDRWQDPGTHTVQFHANGRPSGMYFARLVAGEEQHVERMLIAR